MKTLNFTMFIVLASVLYGCTVYTHECVRTHSYPHYHQHRAQPQPERVVHYEYRAELRPRQPARRRAATPVVRHRHHRRHR
jgi:hypothetical protein